MSTPEKADMGPAPRISRKRRFLASPLLHFLLLGGLLFWGERAFLEPEPEVIIHLTDRDVAALAKGWQDRNGQAPGPELLEALIDSHVRDELLLREARALGWHLTDGIVQRRLLRNQRFLESDEAISDSKLLERAFDQEMDKTDLVVRRRLLERVRLLVASRVRARPPSDAELTDYLAQNAEAFRRPERVGLSHVFLSRDSRGGNLMADSEALGRKLREEGILPQEAGELGDPFLLSHRIPLSSEASIGRQYGPEFAAGVLQAPQGRWSGPIRSSYGAHLVWVQERSPTLIPPLDEIRPRVEAELLREREQAELNAYTERLRNSARVILPAGGA
ncbi:MAG: peptidylprolyl isomerase [Myxococcota bacterium]|nr:peptidylprolyl isomerase [Myxococcota bacterium]